MAQRQARRAQSAPARAGTRVFPLRGHARAPAQRPAVEPLPPDLEFLARRGVAEEGLRLVARLAANRGTAPSRELLATGFDPQRYWSLLADDLGLAFTERLDAAEIVADAGMLATDAVRLAASVVVRIGRETVLVLAPQPDEIAHLRRRLREMPGLAARLRIATPETIRSFLVAERHAALTHYAVNRLARVLPPLSARWLSHARGASGATALVAAVLALAILLPVAMLKALGLLSTLFFFNCSVWKMAAALKHPRPLRLEPLSDQQLPTYTVLVPLYREAAVASELVAHMRRINYPALCIKRTKRDAPVSDRIHRWQTRKSYPRSSASSPIYRATSAILRSA